MTRTRTVTIFQPLQEVNQRIVEVFEGPPGDLLPNARAHGHGLWRLELHGGGLRREVDLHVGDVWLWGDARWRSVTWTPLVEPGDMVPVDRLLPSFVGELGLQEEQGALVLTGAYEPPLGGLGAAMDSVVLGNLARATARNLLGEIALQLRERADV